MTHEKSIDNQVDRRNFLRVQDKVLIVFRPASKEEVDAFLSDEKNIKAEELDVTYQLDQISRQLASLLPSIRQESSAVGQFLELLDKKVDYLASMLSFEKIRNATLDGALETTETLDISEGGMCFLSKQDMVLGDYVYCKLAIMGYRLGMETFGKVVRTEPVGDNKDCYLIGLEFPFLKELDRKNLTRFIFDKQREQLRKRVE